MGTCMGLGAMDVLSGDITVGTFLATLNVYKDLGDRFGGVQRRLNAANSSLEPLVKLVELFNMPTELPDLKTIHERRRLFMRNCLGVGPEVARIARGIKKKLLDDVPIVISN